MLSLCVYAGIVWNKLICGYANIVHTSGSFLPCTYARTHTHTQKHTHTHTHTHILILFEDREPTWLNVDIAGWVRVHGWWLCVESKMDVIGQLCKPYLISAIDEPDVSALVFSCMEQL